MSALPTISELQTLPRLAVVAFAARCARRVEPLFAAGWPGVPPKHLHAVERAIQVAEEVANGGDAKSQTAFNAAKNAYRASVESKSISYYAAFAANAAAHAAAHAAASGQISAVLHAAKLACARATLAAHATGVSVDKVIRADFQILKKHCQNNDESSTTRVSPDIFGPMWPKGAPKGWPAVITRSMGPILHLEFRIPPGIDRGSVTRRIGKILIALSDRHRELGGSGLRIVDGHAYDGAQIHRIEPSSDDNGPSGDAAGSDLAEAEADR